jgi:hypothetical protein
MKTPTVEPAVRAAPLTPSAVPRARALQTLVSGSVVPYVSRQVQYAGRTGVAGLALIVFALAFFIGANSPLRSHLVELQADVEDAQRPHARAEARLAQSPRAELQAFVSRLPARSELPVLTEKIVAQAATAGIALERGTYDFTVTHSGRLVRARMTFPVHGRYPDIRRFVDGTLAAIPDAAVDGLRLERKDIAAAEIDADIRFAIYLRSGP